MIFAVSRTFLSRRPLLALAAVATLSLKSGFAQLPATITPAWHEVAPGVWKTTVGQPETLTLLKAAGGQPATRALAAMPKALFPLDPKEIEGRQFNAKTTLRFPLANNEEQPHPP
jgi:hypothetical protein